MRSTAIAAEGAADGLHDAAVDRLHPSLAFRARLGRWTASWSATCALLDGAMLLAAALATHGGALATGAPTVSPFALTTFVALSFVLFRARGLYLPRLNLDVLEDAKIVVGATTIAAMAAVSLQLVAGADASAADAAAGTLRLWAFAAIYVSAGRVALYWSQTQARRRGEIVSPTLIVGSGSVGELVARRLLEHRELGLLPVGFVDRDAQAARARDGELPIPIVGATDDIERLVMRYDATQVVVNCAGGFVDDELLPLINRCEARGVAVAFVPAAHEKITSRLRVEHVGGLPLITAHAVDPRGWQYAVKYAVDRLVAATLVLFVAPVLVAAAAAVYLSMGRPIFYRQIRVGRDGTQFAILKFRSMKQGAAGSAAGFVVADGMGPGGVEGEDRRTRVGTFLRKSSIDELPQLFNVLKGEMSLVGPRPERPEYVDQFTRTIYRYGERHRVKSGITGWAQVHGLRGKTSIEDRAEWDNYYIENFSLWLDLKILFLTAVAVFRVFKTVE